MATCKIGQLRRSAHQLQFPRMKASAGDEPVGVQTARQPGSVPGALVRTGGKIPSRHLLATRCNTVEMSEKGRQVQGPSRLHRKCLGLLID